MTLPSLPRRRFTVGVAASLGTALGGARLAHAQSEPPLVLGQSAPFSGPAAQLGLQYRAGAQVVFDKVNAQGGVGRRSITLRSLDDGYEPDRCADNTRKLIGAGDLLALFGYVGTPTSLAALPLFTAEKVPFFAPFTGAEALREPFNRQIFHVRASYYDETALIVRQLTHLGVSRIAVFHQNDAYGKAGLDGVTRALAQAKLQSAGTGTVERNSVDVAGAVKKLVAAKPGAIVQIGTYAACAAFVRQARAAGFGGLFYNVSFVGTKALSEALGKEAEGVVVSQVMPSPYQTSRQISREFLADIQAAGAKVDANYSSLEGYLAARIFVEGLRRASQGGRITRDGLIAALETLQTPVAGYSVTFGANDHVASTFVEMSMLTGDGRVRT